MDSRPTLKQTLARWVYSLLLFVLLPVFIILLKSKTAHVQGSHRARWRERFGWVPSQSRQPAILFHCVSVGEVVTATAAIKQVLKQNPEARVVITTTTPTGSARVKETFADSVEHFYLPFDLPFAMSLMIKRLSPKMIVITEVELWPNLVFKAWRKHIPVIVLNARMTDKSARRYAKFSALFTAMLSQLSHVCAQGKRDFDNYLQLGLEKNKLTLTNNLKFDQAMGVVFDGENDFAKIDASAITLVGGSTHAGEEVALLDAYKTLSAQGILLRLILVPRHPQRFDEVANIIASKDCEFIRTSILEKLDPYTSVVLVDEMGKLGQVYAASDIAFVGGSLTDRGGHNALEPAAQGIPIIMGPHTYNNPEICDTLISVGALDLIENTQSLTENLKVLCEDETLRNNKGNAGKQVLIDNQGALQKFMEIFNALSL